MLFIGQRWETDGPGKVVRQPMVGVFNLQFQKGNGTEEGRC
jgi:hypothetical protein